MRYITNLKEMEKAVQKKKFSSYEIKRVVDSWLNKCCNTSLTFSDIQDELYRHGVVDSSADITLLFGRQLPTRKLEHEVLLNLADAIGKYLGKGGITSSYTTSAPSLPVDVMHSKNLEKRCYAEVLMVNESKNGSMAELSKVTVAPMKDMHTLESHRLNLNKGKKEMLEEYFELELGQNDTLPSLHRKISSSKLHKGCIAPVYRSIAAHLLDDVEDGKKPYVKGVWIPKDDGRAELYIIDAEERTASPARRKGESISAAELKEMSPHITAHESYNYLILSMLSYNPQAIYLVRNGLPDGKFQPDPALKLQKVMERELSIPKLPIADFSIYDGSIDPRLLHAAAGTHYIKKLGCDAAEVALQVYLPAMNGTDRSEARHEISTDLSTLASKMAGELSGRMVEGVRRNED